MSVEDTFTHFPRIETARLVLRQIRPGDAAARYTTFSDPEVMAFYGEELHQSVEESRAHIAAVDGWYARREGIRWGVTLRGADEVIGSCGFFNFDEGFHRAELGYELQRAFWRQGIMREALRAILSYGFATMGLGRIEALVSGGNEASAALLRALGFTLEGTLRQRIYLRDRFWDELYFGLLREEWRPD
ncbi:MAG TPA: GNAT family protein [Ktedonobacterales bacterium]|nr:GNAT family protein [Ktedonobacterales bacterium]